MEFSRLTTKGLLRGMLKVLFAFGLRGDRVITGTLSAAGQKLWNLVVMENS